MRGVTGGARQIETKMADFEDRVSDEEKVRSVGCLGCLYQQKKDKPFFSECTEVSLIAFIFLSRTKILETEEVRKFKRTIFVGKLTDRKIYCSFYISFVTSLECGFFSP